MVELASFWALVGLVFLIRSWWLLARENSTASRATSAGATERVKAPAASNVAQETVDRTYGSTAGCELEPPLPHQFRSTIDTKVNWEADFETMILREESLAVAFPSAEVTIYRLRWLPGRGLEMQLSPESRQTQIRILEEGPVRPHSRRVALRPQAAAEIARLKRAEWLPVPESIATELTERYRAFRLGRDN